MLPLLLPRGHLDAAAKVSSHAVPRNSNTASRSKPGTQTLAVSDLTHLSIASCLPPLVLLQDGAAAGDEIDLDKEAEADATRKKAKRQRFERYEDDFIDDSEIEKVKGGPKVKTVYSGFYINRVSSN